MQRRPAEKGRKPTPRGRQWVAPPSFCLLLADQRVQISTDTESVVQISFHNDNKHANFRLDGAGLPCTLGAQPHCVPQAPAAGPRMPPDPTPLGFPRNLASCQPEAAGLTGRGHTSCQEPSVPTVHRAPGQAPTRDSKGATCSCLSSPHGAGASQKPCTQGSRQGSFQAMLSSALSQSRPWTALESNFRQSLDQLRIRVGGVVTHPEDTPVWVQEQHREMLPGCVVPHLQTRLRGYNSGPPRADMGQG